MTIFIISLWGVYFAVYIYFCTDRIVKAIERLK
jgi:hypothetical protein